MTINVRLLFFGKAADLVNKREDELQLPSNSIEYKQLEELIFKVMKTKISELIAIKLQLYSQLSPISKNCLIAVNQRYCQEPSEILRLNEQSEIAVFPPLSGG